MSSSVVRVTRVMLNSAWVTESWSSRARWARSWLEAELAGLPPQVVLEAARVSLMSRVEPCDAGEGAVDASSPSELTSTGTGGRRGGRG